MPAYDVIGMGNALMDIIVDVDDEFLKDMNVEKGSMTLIDDAQHKKLLAMINRKKLVKSTGGSASNTSKGVCILGGKSAFLGMVGNDDYGKTYEKLLSKAGIKASLAKSSKSTGTSIVCITPDGERTMMTYLGAACEFRDKDVDEKLIKDSKMLHIEGYFIGDTETSEAVIKAMKIAKKNNKLISMDLSDAGLIHVKIEDFKELLEEYVDIAFVNEHEAKAFTGSEEEDAVNKLGEYCEYAIVKLGEKGSIIKHDGKIHHIPIFPVKTINTTGAGDAYAAGILYSIAHKIPIEKAGLLAAYISSRVVAIPEATLNYSLKDEVKKILEQKKK